MEKIYLITNLINKKQYVGQTKKTLEQRLARHIYDSKREKLEHLPLYRAFKKYGTENFKIKLIGEFNESLIEEKEKYYIKRYDTYNNGYNATLGGESRNRIQTSAEEIVAHYLKSKSCRETGRHFGIDKDSVSLRVKAAGHKILDGRERQSKGYKVEFPNGDIKEFHSCPHIAEHLLEIGYPLGSNKIDTIRKGLAKALKNNSPYYKLYITKD